MNDDEIWAAIDNQRCRTADLLDQLTEAEWRQPSLCPGWTVRDVAAHLTLQNVGAVELMWSMLMHPTILGSINRTIRVSAQQRAELPVDQLIGRIRAMVGSRRHNVGVTNLEVLTDILVHGQDIVIPLHRGLEMPAIPAATAATRVWSYRNKGKARVFHKIPLDGLRVTATDTPWSVGEGREVLGPIAAILLLLTGRVAALPRLGGEGSEFLRRQLLSA